MPAASIPIGLRKDPCSDSAGRKHARLSYVSVGSAFHMPEEHLCRRARGGADCKAVESPVRGDPNRPWSRCAACTNKHRPLRGLWKVTSDARCAQRRCAASKAFDFDRQTPSAPARRYCTVLDRCEGSARNARRLAGVRLTRCRVAWLAAHARSRSTAPPTNDLGQGPWLTCLRRDVSPTNLARPAPTRASSMRWDPKVAHNGDFAPACWLGSKDTPERHASCA